MTSGPIRVIAQINMQGSKSNALADEGKVAFSLQAMHGHDVHAILTTSAWPAEDSMHQSELFVAEHPVSPFPLQDSEKDWMTSVATLCSPLDIFLASTGQPGSFGKTSPAYCRVTQDETLRAFWDSSQDRSSNLQQTDGEQAGLSQELDQPTVSPTAYLTLNLREAPTILGLSLKDEGVCSLSDILETGDVPQRYYLTPKACRGILRRAEKRGKELPGLLKAALESVATRTQATETEEG